MLILLMMYHLLVSRSIGVGAIYCAFSLAAETDNSYLVESTPCDIGVQHCLVTLNHIDGTDSAYKQNAHGCWPWDELTSNCPSVSGICQVQHVAGDELHKTCCCHGDMCNNDTLAFLPASNWSVVPKVLDDELGRFGLHDGDPIPRDSGHMMRYFFPLVITLCLLTTVGLVCLVLTGLRHRLVRTLVRLGWSPCWFTGAATTASIDQTAPEVKLSLSHMVSPVSPKADPLADVGSIDKAERLPSEGRLHHYHSPTRSNPMDSGCVQPSYITSEEWSVMENVARECRKDKCIGRGRFATVWKASIPCQCLYEFSQVHRLHRTDDTAATPTMDHSLPRRIRLTTLSEPSNGNSRPSPRSLNQTPMWTRLQRSWIWCFSRVTERIALNQSLGNQGGQNSIFSDLSPHENRVLLPTNVIAETGDHAPDHFGTLPRAKDSKHWKASLQPTTNHMQSVAVKMFTSTESRAWSAELATFRAIQGPFLIGNREGVTCADAEPWCMDASNSNVVRLLGAGVMTNSPSTEYQLVMEFVAGGSLFERLQAGDWLTPSHVFSLGRDIANGLSYLHNDVPVLQTNGCNSGGTVRPHVSIAHRDLKPANVLLRANGTACLSDFGQSVVLDSDLPNVVHLNSSTDSGLVPEAATNILTCLNPNMESVPKAGTLRYMAPELLDGAINFTGFSLLRTDVYSLGLILWELLSAAAPRSSDGEHPSTDTIKSLVPETHTPGLEPPLTSHLKSSLDQTTPNNDALKHELSSQYNRSIHSQQIRRHWLPYEKELGAESYSLHAMHHFVSMEKRRPVWNPWWYDHPLFIQFYRTITECWDPEPEARLTAGCVVERLNLINPPHLAKENSY